MNCRPKSSLGISSRDLRSNSILAMSFFQNSICKSMTFRIDYFHEDFSGLTRCQPSTVPVERWFLLLIQQYIYRQRVNNASQFCIKLKNLRFSFGYLNILESTSAVALAASRPRSSNRTCGATASGFPTGFTSGTRRGRWWLALETQQAKALMDNFH